MMKHAKRTLVNMLNRLNNVNMRKLAILSCFENGHKTSIEYDEKNRSRGQHKPFNILCSFQIELVRYCVIVEIRNRCNLLGIESIHLNANFGHLLPFLSYEIERNHGQHIQSRSLKHNRSSVQLSIMDTVHSESVYIHSYCILAEISYIFSRTHT